MNNENSEAIRLNDIFCLTENEMLEYKVHLSCFSGKTQPLDVFLSDENEYLEWQQRKDGEKDKFNRRYIMSFAQVYVESNDIYLFTGIYEVVSDSVGDFKSIKSDKLAKFVGKLKMKHKRGGQGHSFKLENCAKDKEGRGGEGSMMLHEILPSTMQYKVFKGYSNVHLRFNEIENIIKMNLQDWKAALSSVYGVYLLRDKSNGKVYVGSATGGKDGSPNGIWGRWCSYVDGQTGGNKGLIELANEVGRKHFKEHFTFTLLEHFTAKTEVEYVFNRENYWKEVFDSKNENFGYNRN